MLTRCGHRKLASTVNSKEKRQPDEKTKLWDGGSEGVM